MDRRLQLIYDMTENTNTVADVGTDHGYLICSLVQGGKVKQGIATDINKLPLESAINEIAKLNLQDKIITYLTDGLQSVDEDIDSVIVAGMGGELISKIIVDSDYKAHSERMYYLQPMTKSHVLRQFLLDNGFVILEEKCTVAGNRPYSVIKTKWTDTKESYSLYDLYMGKICVNSDSYAREYVLKLIEQMDKKIFGLKHNEDREEYLKYKELCDKLKSQIDI